MADLSSFCRLNQWVHSDGTRFPLVALQCGEQVACHDDPATTLHCISRLEQGMNSRQGWFDNDAICVQVHLSLCRDKAEA
eukprot:3413244-Amphidinium_carterae.1